MNKTKFAALALSFAVAASPFGAAAAEDGHWAQKSLERLAGMGILTGDDEGNLLPDNTITRAELFTMLNRAAGITKISGLSFTDVAEKCVVQESGGYGSHRRLRRRLRRREYSPR